MSDLLAGFLGALLAVNAPPAASDAAPSNTAISAPAVNTNDPVEQEYHRILVDDDDAEQEILGWLDSAEAFAKAGGGASSLTLNSRIQQRLDGIRKEYADFVQLHPKHAKARLAFGSFLYENHDEAGAAQQWETARDLEPTNPAAWNDLGKLCGDGHHGPIKKAFEYYDKAISLDSSQSTYYYNLAIVVYMYRNDAREYYNLDEKQVFEKALDLYRRAIKLDPDNFVLFSDYAMCFYGTTPPRWKDGLEAWTQALKIAHDDVEREGVYIHLARIQIKLGQFDQARASLNVVTNDNYAKLKALITRNLQAAQAKTDTNAPMIKGQ